MIIEQQRLARGVVVAAEICEALPCPLHIQGSIVPPLQSFGIERHWPGLRGDLCHQGVPRARRRGLGEQLIVPYGLFDDRPQVARGRSCVTEIGPPGVAGADEQPLCTSDGDVRQPVLGKQLLAAELLFVFDHSCISRLGELRDRSGIPAQVCRQD
jgi:hypothetical protein